MIEKENLFLRIPYWPQWMAAFEVFLMMLLFGASAGFTSPLIGKLVGPNPPFEVTKEQTTWIISLISLSRPLGIISGTIVNVYFGSKISTLSCGFFFLIGWISLIFAKTIESVFVTYICNGCGIGSLFTTCPIFLGEIANPAVRGRLVSVSMQGAMLGLLLGNSMGEFLDPWVFGVMFLIPSLIYLTTFPFFPNTPQYLISCNKISKATESLAWYNPHIDPEKELLLLVEFMNKNPKLSFVETVKKLTLPANRNALFIVNIIFSVLQLNGYLSVLQYMEVLLISSRVDVIRPATVVTIVSAISVACSLSSMFFCDKFGRTTLLSLSFFLLAASLFTWGFNFHFIDLGYTNSNLQWIAIISATLFRVSMDIGFTPIAPTLIGEMFSPDIKSMSCCFCNVTASICSFIANKYFVFFIETLSTKYVMYLTGLLTLCIAFYAKFGIPETKGKTLSDIQDILERRFSVKKSDTTVDKSKLFT